jgi:hypothetical protein
MDVTISGLRPIQAFGVTFVEPSDSATREIVQLLFPV